MEEPVSLMEFVKLLLADEAERVRFAADPDGSLARHGLGELSPADVHDAVLLVQDTLTVDWSQAYGSGAPAEHAMPVEHAPPAHSIPAELTGWWSPGDADPVVEHEQPVTHAVGAEAVDPVDAALHDTPDLHLWT